MKGIGAHRGWLFALLLAAAVPGAMAAEAAEAAGDDAGANADCSVDSQGSGPACKTGTLCWCAGGGVEYRRDKVILDDLVMYQGGSPLMVRAHHAETASIDTANSTWNLSGGVKSRLAQGQLAAESATVHLQADEMTAATFEGNPATFQENGSAANAANGTTAVLGIVRGSARTIEYDTVGGGEVRLRGDVQLFDGCKDIHGDGFVYNLVQKSLKSLEPAAGASRERVRGTFQQKCKPTAASPSATAPGNAGATTPATTPPAPPTPAAAPAADTTPPKSP